MKQIKPSKLDVEIVRLWDKQWFLLTAGNETDFNMMTVSWGSIGCIWNKPFAQVVVRPQRHTYQFIDKYPDFTLCAFPEKYRDRPERCYQESMVGVDSRFHNAGMTFRFL